MPGVRGPDAGNRTFRGEGDARGKGRADHPIREPSGRYIWSSWACHPGREKSWDAPVYRVENQSVYAGDNIRTGRVLSIPGRTPSAARGGHIEGRPRQTGLPTTRSASTRRETSTMAASSGPPIACRSLFSTVADAAHPLTNCRDIWGVRAAEREAHLRAYFVTAHGDDARGYVLGGYNKARFAWSEPFKDRRAVSILRLFDIQNRSPTTTIPIEKEPALHDVHWIVYVGCQASADVFVKASDQLKCYLPIPPSWTSYTGIWCRPDRT